jgi:hypothetical protein
MLLQFERTSAIADEGDAVAFFAVVFICPAAGEARITSSARAE